MKNYQTKVLTVWTERSESKVSFSVVNSSVLLSFFSYRHTGIVVFGREYFFGGGGIEYCFPVSLCRTFYLFTVLSHSQHKLP